MKKQILSKRQLILIGFILILLLVSVVSCRKAGSWLIKSEAINHADAIVLFMGGIPADRILTATDIHKQSHAPKIIFVEEAMNALNILNKRGASVISNTTQCRNALVQLGIPADSIIILPGDARSTQQEATIIRDYLKMYSGIDTITLVTSADHTRRASMIFEKAFKKEGIVIQCSSNKYTQYTGQGWWKNKEDIQTVLTEYLKLVNFWLFEKRKL
jgi:uncharacterized SAM-binding protein YcdF (DUF218 family)